jgi:hypothetical protein
VNEFHSAPLETVRVLAHKVRTKLGMELLQFDHWRIACCHSRSWFIPSMGAMFGVGPEQTT